MKKLFLFIGVIMLCLLFSCKKDNPPPPPPPPIDSFLLHPPPVLDSLPIPLTIGTWWKYQRIDSTFYKNQPLDGSHLRYIDSSIELITVIGESPIVDSVQETVGPWRKRYDTVKSFMLEVKNLTKGSLDTIHAYYYNASFLIKSKKDTFNLFIYLPVLEGKAVAKAYNPSASSRDTTILNKNISVKVLDQNFDNCIYYYYDYSIFLGPYSESATIITYLKSGIGFVDWEHFYTYYSHYGYSISRLFYRRLIDYHVAP
jgi:hypothetical protein